MILPVDLNQCQAVRDTILEAGVAYLNCFFKCQVGNRLMDRSRDDIVGSDGSDAENSPAQKFINR